MIYFVVSSGLPRPPVGLPALRGPLLAVSRPPSGLPPLSHVSSGGVLVDPAAGAPPVGQEVGLEVRGTRPVGVGSARAAAKPERRRPAAGGEERPGRGQPAGGVLQLDRGLPAETRAWSADRQQTPTRKTTEEHQGQQPHLHAVPSHAGELLCGEVLKVSLPQ